MDGCANIPEKSSQQIGKHIPHRYSILSKYRYNIEIDIYRYKYI